MKNSFFVFHRKENIIKLFKRVVYFIFCTIAALYTFSIEIVARPAQITDLSASNDFQLRLTWTAPANGNGNGSPCSSYFVKYSTSGDITSNDEFIRSNTYYHLWQPLPAGNKETKILSDLAENTTYWFSIRSSSGAEWSEISSTGTNFAVAGPYKAVDVSSDTRLEYKPRKAEDKTATVYAEAVACFRKKEYLSAYEKFTAIVDTPSVSTEKYVKDSKKYVKRIMSRILGIIKKGKEGKDMNYAAGFLLYLDKRYDESLAEFREFLKAEPGNKEAPQYAEILAGKIEEEKKQQINNYLVKAKAFLGRKKYNEAIKELEGLLIISPGYPEASNLVKEIKLEIEERKKKIEAEKLKMHEGTAEKQDAPENVYTTIIDSGSPKEIIIGTTTTTRKHNVDVEKAAEYYRTAMKKYEEGYLKKAIESLEDALIYNPGDARIKEALTKIKQEYENQKSIPE